ncbi:MAG: DUF3038 domain-containing protein [Synechococcales bacterium]|nr:DUF3038 domain-containing protein [Synechococcales bacterium]
MQLNPSSASSSPPILESLRDFPVADGLCPRRPRMQLDLLLLAIEALDLSGSEAILVMARELELQSIIPDRVNLWRLRSTNSLRRSSQRQPMTLVEAKALTVILCYLARRLTVVVRQLLLSYHKLLEEQKPPTEDFYLATYLQRFRSHFRARMNPRRAAAIGYESDEQLNQLGMGLLEQILFCTGTSGMQRLWTSLFDGEVA